MGAAYDFNQVVKGSNFMTPNVIEYGYIAGIPYEISEGEGFSNDRIFGFTLGLEYSDPRREHNDCFPSLTAVREHIEDIEGEL